MLFARPSDETARQIEARLERLLASDGSAESLNPVPGPVPAPLQNAVDILLELVSEVERVTRYRAGALALYQSAREVSCAYVGGGEPDVWSHGQRYDAPWVALRAGVDEGNGAPTARGFAVFAHRDLDMRLQWPYLLGTPRPEGVVVDARWRAPQGFEITVRELSGHDLPRKPDEDAESRAASEATSDGRGEFFAGWFDDLGRANDAQPPRPIPTLAEGEAVMAEKATAARLPTGAFPDRVEASRDQAERELPADETADGAEDRLPPSRNVRRPVWPVMSPARHQPANARKRASWVAFVLALFIAGWALGTRGGERAGIHGGRAPFAVQLMRAMGLASPRFTARITSTPPGALIVIDGNPSPYRTPAEIELVPGTRHIGLALPNLGLFTTLVEGKRGTTVPIDVPLTGTLHVSAPNPSTPVAVTLDGEERGFAPIEVKGIAPGPHELRYTSPGQPSWSQTTTLPMRGDVHIVARPFDLPAMGVIHVGATWTDDDGSKNLRGASVTIDGERRGSTPLTLDLPRGPHSLRAQYRGEELPVQVIDLPGGNERFASFSFGTGAVFPRLVLQSPRKEVSREVPTPVSVAMEGLFGRDIREVWLHVRAPDASWRRYPMTLSSGAAVPVAGVVFPAALLDARGDAPFYVSALVSTGEEYFTDINGSAARARPRARRAAVVPRAEP